MRATAGDGQKREFWHHHWHHRFDSLLSRRACLMLTVASMADPMPAVGDLTPRFQCSIKAS